jgi:hypothetical protein
MPVAERPAGFIALIRATIVTPSRAMRDLADRPGRRWIVPILLTAAFGVLTAIVGRDAMLAAARAELDAQMAAMPSGALTDESRAAIDMSLGFGFVLAAIGALVGPIVAAFVIAALFHLGGTILGGQQTYAQMLAASAWARLPLAFQEMLRFAAALVGVWDPNQAGLSGLVAGPGGDAEPSYWAPLLAELSLWNVWSLCLLGIAVHVVSKVSARKAAGLVLAFVVLKLVVGAAGVVVGRFSASLAGL